MREAGVARQGVDEIPIAVDRRRRQVDGRQDRVEQPLVERVGGLAPGDGDHVAIAQPDDVRAVPFAPVGGRVAIVSSRAPPSTSGSTPCGRSVQSVLPAMAATPALRASSCFGAEYGMLVGTSTAGTSGLQIVAA